MYKMSFKSYAGVALAAALIAAGGMMTAPASNADSASYVDPMSYGQQTGQPAGQQYAGPARRQEDVERAADFLDQRADDGAVAPAAGLQRQLRAARVVDVDDRRLQAGPVEQHRLGRPVGVHAAVVVQVVLREVGEDGGVDLRAVEPCLGQSNRLGLDGAGTEALRHKLGKRALQAHRVGRGHAGGGQRRRHSQAQSAHQRTLILP